MKKSTLLLTLLLLLHGQASATSPDTASKIFRNINYCRLLFQEFDYSKSKHKKVGVIVYKSDINKIQEMEKYFTAIFTKEFEKDDFNKIYILGITESGLSFFEKADDFTQTDVEKISSDCRKMLYSFNAE